MSEPLETIPIVETERLRLRPLATRDVDGYFAMFSDPEVMRYWSGSPITTLEEAATLLGRDLSRERVLTWALTRRGDDAIVGRFAFFALQEKNRRAELGYMLRRDVWGQGLMSEVFAWAIPHAFDTLGLHRLEADIDPQNSRSLALAERFGFRREGLLRQRWRVNDTWCDSVMLGLLATDPR